MEDIRTVLTTAGITETVLFTSAARRAPDSDGPFIVITSYGGPSPEYVHNQLPVAYEYPAVQILVQARGGDTASQLADRVWRAFPVRNALINGTWYVSITPRQSPFDLGMDETKGLSQFVFNVLADKRPG